MTDKTLILQNDKQSLSTLFVPKKPQSNKGDFGNALIIGGCKNYIGAPMFSLFSLDKMLVALGDASMLVGAGTSAIAVPDFLVDAIYNSVRHSAIYSMPQKDGYLSFDESVLSSIINHKTAVAIGMGVGVADIKPFIDYLLKNNCKFVVDADGLKCVNDVDFNYKAVLTPHIGEFAKMTGCSIDEIKQNKVKLACDFAVKHKCILVLKDHISYITDGNMVYENNTGNAGLAKGGSGDVLSGIICGLLAIGFSPLDSARAGSYILGKCAEISGVNEYSSMPEDIIKSIPKVVESLIC